MVLASASRIGDEIEDWEISARSLARIRGFDIRFRKMMRIADAVVSDPAILGFVSCLGWDRPFGGELTFEI